MADWAAGSRDVTSLSIASARYQRQAFALLCSARDTARGRRGERWVGAGVELAIPLRTWLRVLLAATNTARFMRVDTARGQMLCL
jgi:hypothetical protein